MELRKCLHILNTIIRKLFDKNFNYAHKILALEPREVYAFVLNNADRLRHLVREAMAAEMAQMQLDVQTKSLFEFHIPRSCLFTYNGEAKTQIIYKKNVQLYRKRNAEEANSIPAKYIVGYHDIPDKDLTAYPLVSTSIAAKDVDYDLIVYDTYDYLDKLIGFKLSDIFYAIFYQYYEATSDERALRLAKYFKYGTDKEREIWMLRYGFSFEEIEWVSECVDSIDETEIKFNDKINALDDAQLKSIEQYVHE